MGKSKTYTVHLYRAPECIRGWLAYIRDHQNDATFIVQVEAESGAKAKNAAITAANNEFKGVKIVGCGYSDDLWGLDRFPELKRFVPWRKV